ncbi:MAG: Hsp33 family molecular chaperone HslO [Polyangiaceae bacterium]
MVRAMDEDGNFRVLTCDVTDTVKATLASQSARGSETRSFGELLVATILFRETMSPQLRVQGIAKAANETGQLIADSHPTGDVRGLVQRRDAESEVSLVPGSTLRMMRSLPNGSINQGIVELSGKGTISEGVMAYMQTSEQIVTMVGVGVSTNAEGQVERAGGYLVQLLPGAKRGPLMVMTERLKEFEDVLPYLERQDFTPDGLLDELLYAMPHTRLGESTVRFHCWCDELKLLGALSTLPKADLEELAQSGEALHINCDYCQKAYEIAPNLLKGLLTRS